MNGLYGADKNVGHFTCKDASAIDYIIVSPNLTRSLVDFQVLEFESILSDVHCPVYLNIDGFSESSNGCKVSDEGSESNGIHKKLCGKMKVVKLLLKALI